MRRSSSRILGLLVISSLIFPFGAVAESSGPGLSSTEDRPAPAAPRLFEVVDTSPLLKSSRPVVGAVSDMKIDIDVALIDSDPEALTIPLGNGRLVTVERHRFISRAGVGGKNHLSWSGHKTRENGSLVFLHLVDHGSQVTGLLNIGREQYQVVPQRDGSRESGHRFVRVERQGYACGHEGAGEWVEQDLSPSDRFTETGAEKHSGDWAFSPPDPSPEKREAPGLKTPSSPIRIDVLAIYPSSFSGAAEISLRQFITTSVEQANLIFDNSGIDAEYFLVGMEKLLGADQPDVTSVQTALQWMAVVGHGLDVDNLGPQEMVDLRNEYAADMVALFIPSDSDGTNACGVATLPNGEGDIILGNANLGDFGSRAFSVMRDGCGLNDFTFAHELGHNYGMRHHTFDEASENPRYPRGRGYSRSVAPWTSLADGTPLIDQPGMRVSGYIFKPLTDGYIVGVGGLFHETAPVSVQPISTASSTSADIAGRCTTTAVPPRPCEWEYAFFPEMVPVFAGEKYAVYESGIQQNTATIYQDLEPMLPLVSGGIEIMESFEDDGNGMLFDEHLVTYKDRMLGNVDIRFIPTAALSATVMACADPDPSNTDIFVGECARIPYFSDPTSQVYGLVLGLPTFDNVSVADAQILDYSAFRTNLAPVCQDLLFATDQATVLTLSSSDILPQSIDLNGDNLFLIDVAQASNGSVTELPPDRVEYAPDRSFTGFDSFEYTISDRPAGHSVGLTATCMIEVAVGADNAALRYRALSVGAVDLRVQEDQTLDGETAHISESVDFLVLGGDGTLSGIRQ